jgi:hypothetical protein
VPSPNEVWVHDTIIALSINPVDRLIGKASNRQNLTFNNFRHFGSRLKVGESVILSDLGLHERIIDPKNKGEDNISKGDRSREASSRVEENRFHFHFPKG